MVWTRQPTRTGCGLVSTDIPTPEVSDDISPTRILKRKSGVTATTKERTVTPPSQKRVQPMDYEPLSDAERYLSTIRIMCAALIEAVEHPDTHLDPDVGMRLAAEIEVASAMLGKVH